MIDLYNITVSRSGKKLFENFNFSIKPGEHWVIQGDNGSGKTMLLELIAGLLHPSSGGVNYDFIPGDDWQERYDLRERLIRYVPAHALQTFLGGYQGLFYQQRYYSMGDTTIPKVKDFLWDDSTTEYNFPDSFNIHQLLELELTRLSNGQLKKVLILQQLSKGIPRFLLLDYPLEGLDYDSRNDFIDFIDSLSKTFAVQIVMVHHDHDLPKIINRRLLLRDFTIAEMAEVETRSHTAVKEPVNEESKGGDPSKPVVVEMKELTIQYGGRKIIENLNWIIRQGERWALTGRNGSGKTTLFSLIYADHPMAYSQKIFLFGKRRGSGESIWDIKARINYLGPEQIHFLNPKGICFSARQYILNNRHPDAERLSGLLEIFDAQRFVDEPVRNLSSGQLQIILLLAFFMLDKELLLLDEPFQFLDPLTKQKAIKYLNDCLDEDVTLILITHYEKDVLVWTNLRMTL
jgi:molybdate transport system ATP-binding protein